LPTSMRFSRAIILLTSAWSLVMVQTLHIVIGYYRKNVFTVFNKRKRIAIVGNNMETDRVQKIMKRAGVCGNYVGQISPTVQITSDEQMASINQLSEFVRVNEVDEVIFCSADISSQDIITKMLDLLPHGVDYKIAPPDSISIIGSNSIETSGDLYTIDISAISKPENLRRKRLVDLGVALTLILFSPIFVFFFKRFGRVFCDAFSVLFGLRTWVGYFNGNHINIQGLPQIRKGVFPPLHAARQKANIEKAVKERVNIIYAKNYSVATDLAIIWSHLLSLDPS
jgi:O-antigen biosynthesis protein